MNDTRKTKKQLIDELNKLRERIGILEGEAPDRESSPVGLAELARERNLLQTLVDNLPDEIYAKDAEHRFTMVNRTVVRNFGAASAGEVIGRTDDDFFAPALAAAFRQEEHELMTTGAEVLDRQALTAKPGQNPFWTLVTKVPLRDRQTGQIVGLVGLNRDIGNLKRVELEMLAVERQYRLVLDAMTDAVHVIDSDFRIALFNQAFLDWLNRYGLGGDPQGRSLREVMPFLPENGFDEYRRLFASEVVQNREFEANIRGQRLVIEARKIPLIDTGRVVRVVTILRDVTERKQMEESLRASEARIRQIVDSLPIVLGSFEAGTGRLLLLQGDLSSILGYGYEQFLADPHLGARIVHPEDQAAAYRAFDKGMASKRPFSMAYRIIHGERGTPVYLQRYLVPVCDADDRVVRQDSVIIDVTVERESQQRIKTLSQVVEQTSEGVAVADLAGRLLFLNGACAAMHGGRADDFLGEHLSVFHAPEQMHAVNEANRRLLEAGKFEGEVWHRRRDGVAFLSEMHNSLLRDESGDPVAIVGLMQDVTARKEMQSASARLAEAVRNSGEGIAIWDKNWALVYANGAMCSILGCDCFEDLAAREVLEFLSGDGHAGSVDWRTALGRESAWRGRMRAQRLDGSTVPLAVSLSRLRQDDGTDLYVGNVHDMSREEAQLTQIRRLGREAATVLDKERARISKELHDELGQELTAMNLGLAWLGSRLFGAPEPVKERLNELQELQQQMTQTVRGLARSLRPALFDYQPMVDALQSLAAEYSRVGTITCSLEAVPGDIDVENPLKTVIYRIAQEALTNVVRHARATRCSIEVREKPRSLELRISDNGAGSDPARLEGTESLGIIGMKERAASIGGELRVESLSQGGVCVTAVFPRSQRGIEGK